MPSLRVVKPDERPSSPAELALEEIWTMRKGLDRLEALTTEILADKRRQLDRLEIVIRATTGQEIAPSAA